MKIQKLFKILTFISGAFITQFCYSQAAQLDETFGNGRIVTKSFGVSSQSNLYTTALQSDGKIIAVGSTNNQDNSMNFAITRFCKDGSLDPTFGCNGGWLLFIQADIR